VVGLRAASQLAAHQGQSQDATLYQQAAQTLVQAITTHLIDPTAQVLMSDQESKSLGLTGYLDAAGVEAFLHQVLDPRSAVSDNTLAAWRTHLGLNTGPGFKRNDDGDAYDEREWIMIDLRLAALHFLRGEATLGQALLDWVTAMAQKNYYLIPELLDQSTADYRGETPMVGFGAGAYVLCLFARAAGPAPTPDAGVPDDGHQDSGVISPDGSHLDAVRTDVRGPDLRGGDPSTTRQSEAGCTCSLTVSPPARQILGELAGLLLFCSYLLRRWRGVPPDPTEAKFPGAPKKRTRTHG
jgi:hypothetical protein